MPTPSLVQSATMPRWAHLGHGLPRVSRLGLATRGNTHLTADDVARAVDRGVNYLNWCGYDDGIASALCEKRIYRSRVLVAMQLEARDGPGAKHELAVAMRRLATGWIDVVTFYYVEADAEWAEIAAPGGALEALNEARERGQVKLIGLTTHQRRLASLCAASRRLDLLMVRYNAAHRGAEEDILPVTGRLGLPVVGFTAQRWGALVEPTPDDPPGFTPPPAREWYRFALAQPAIDVVLMAPNNRQELEENLILLDDWRAPTPEEHKAMLEHGQRVRRHAGAFP